MLTKDNKKCNLLYHCAPYRLVFVTHQRRSAAVCWRGVDVSSGAAPQHGPLFGWIRIRQQRP